MANQVFNGEQTFVDQNGDPLSGGLVYMYFPNTTNFSTTWQDQAGTIPNTNPIVLNQAGRAIIWGVGSYRQVVTDQFGNVQWDQITTSGPTVPMSGEVAGDLSVGGGATIAGSLIVGGTITATGDIGTAGILLADQIQARTGSVINVTSALQLGGLSIADNNLITNGTVEGTNGWFNNILVDSISPRSVGAVTITAPIILGPIDISTDGNITGVGSVVAVNFDASGSVNTNNLNCNGASLITVSCGITVSAGNITTDSGDILAISTFQPTLSAFNSSSGRGFGFTNPGSGLAFGATNSAGVFQAQLMFMDASGNLTVNGLNINSSLTVNGNITASGEIITTGGGTFAANLIPNADNVASVGQSGQRWATMFTYDMVAQNYITASTDQASPQQAVACLPLVSSIDVKTAPHIGLAREDCSSIPGAQISAGGVDGVSNNAIVACLWKALQELNAAFNAYVAAHP